MKRFLCVRWIPLIILLTVGLACSLSSQTPKSTETAPPVLVQNTPLPQPTQPAAIPAEPTLSSSQPAQPQNSNAKEYEFPVPDDAANINDSSGMVNFQTQMSLKDTLAFYRQELQAKGLKERKITTVESDTMFYIVFDGSPNGKALVVQGVALGTSTNVNIRYEDV